MIIDSWICIGLDCKRMISLTNVLGIHFGNSSGKLILKTAIEDVVRTMANRRMKVALKNEIKIVNGLIECG